MEAHTSSDPTAIPVKPRPAETLLGLSPESRVNGIQRPQSGWTYPAPPTTGGVTETLHGVEIRDPWRELENLDSEETQRFIKQQNATSMPILQSHPHRRNLESAVRQIYTYERTSAPSLQGDGYYYWRYNQGDWARDVVLRSTDLKRDFGKFPGEGVDCSDHLEIVFDPNQEKMTSIYADSWSPCGRYYNVILQEAGSDWQKIRTLDTTTKQPVDDDLFESKFTFGVSWIGSSGFLYKKPIRPDSGATSTGADSQFGIYYHHLRTPQSADMLVWYGKGEEARSLITGRPVVCSWDVSGTEGGRRWVFWNVYRNTNPETECFIFELPSDLNSLSGEATGQELAQLIANPKWLSTGYTGDLHYIGTRSDDTLLFQSTTDKVTLGRVVTASAASIDAAAPGETIKMEELVPTHPSGLNLLSCNLVDDSVLVLVYLKDACAEVVFADAKTGQTIGSSDRKGTRGHATTTPNLEVPVPPEELSNGPDTRHASVIPAHATISAVSSRSDCSDFYLSVDTFVAPPYVLSGKVTPGTDEPEIKLSRLDHASAPEEDLVCTQTFYESFDGVKIPLFISHARDLDLSKPQPTLLYAYGGSAVCITPTFNPQFTTFMRNVRGIVAVACIRGGGEYGKDWHDCAVGLNRYICYEDFSHAARYLHSKGLTTPALTASYGISNGGTLVASSMNRDPELWGVVCPDVGVFDLTRFHLFTLGRLWKSELGDPQDANSLPYIHAMSPLHQVKKDPSVKYPAVFITTGDHDVRVIPGHSLKLLAELQEKKKDNQNIFLGRIYENAGHEASSKSTDQKIEEAVDRLIFIIWAMGL